MNSKIDNTQLKLGDEIYVVHQSYSHNTFKQGKVVLLRLEKDGSVSYQLDFETYPTRHQSYDEYVTRSKIKAQRVLAACIKQDEAYILRRAKANLIHDENEKNLPAMIRKYVGNSIMIKVDSDKWVKVIVGSVTSTYTPGVYCLFTQARSSYYGNHYLTSREGKTWYPWTELDELMSMRKELDRRIAEATEKQIAKEVSNEEKSEAIEALKDVDDNCK